MQVTLLVHILAGAVAIVAGYAALAASKGAWLHRGSGTLFVYAMVSMGLSATVLSAANGARGTMLGGLLVAYLVVTGLRAVRPPDAAQGCPDRALALLGFAVGVALIAMGMDALGNPGGRANGVPGGAILLNGVVALVASVGDVRVIRVGGIRGAPRLARHLWRMCYALWMAAGSFFLGQADELPAPLRIYPLLAIPAVLPLAAMAWWLWRVRGRRLPRFPWPHELSMIETSHPQRPFIRPVHAVRANASPSLPAAGPADRDRGGVWRVHGARGAPGGPGADWG